MWKFHDAEWRIRAIKNKDVSESDPGLNRSGAGIRPDLQNMILKFREKFSKLALTKFMHSSCINKSKLGKLAAVPGYSFYSFIKLRKVNLAISFGSTFAISPFLLSTRL